MRIGAAYSYSKTNLELLQLPSDLHMIHTFRDTNLKCLKRLPVTVMKMSLSKLIFMFK